MSPVLFDNSMLKHPATIPNQVPIPVCLPPHHPLALWFFVRFLCRVLERTLGFTFVQNSSKRPSFFRGAHSCYDW